MAAFISQRATLTMKDRQGKKSDAGFGVSNADVSAWVLIQGGGTGTAAIDTLLNAAKAMSEGVEVGRKADCSAEQPAAANPTSITALRKNKLAISLGDNVTGRVSTATIPIADATKYALNPGSNTLILTGSGVTSQTTALISAIQATALSKAGNAVTVLQIKAVGRAVQ